jgi:hypothetical protein
MLQHINKKDMSKKIEMMMFVIKYEYEKEELGKYKPKKFKTYLLEKLAEIRVSKGLWQIKQKH